MASVADFSPDHFRRKSTRLVSYYALFKGVAASKPTSQLSERIHILWYPLSPHSGTLADGLGSYPLAAAHYRTAPVSRDLVSRVFGVCLESVGCETPSSMQCSTPQRKLPRPYLNTFRREPAISQLDWPFTPTHSSSERFSTHNGSVLHPVLPGLQPGHG